MRDPGTRLKDLFDRHGGMRRPGYERLHIAALPRSGSAIAYFELGDPRGEPLLCLHGLSVSGLYFEQHHRYFVSRGIRAIAPCLLGGIHLADPGRTFVALTDELIELLDVLALPRVDTLGFSWGTLPQLALMARAPDRIDRAALLGAMLPTPFLSSQELAALKSDIRLSLAMAGRVAALHRALMWLVGRLPASALLGQFQDEHLSAAELDALTSGGSFQREFVRLIEECRSTGSAFYTDGWRMLLDPPGYALADLGMAAARVDVNLYVGEHDNVHLPLFAHRIAAAHSGVDVAEVARGTSGETDSGPFRRVFVHKRTRVLMAPGAGRMSCMLHLPDALDDLTSRGRTEVQPPKVAAGQAAARDLRRRAAQGLRPARTARS